MVFLTATKVTSVDTYIKHTLRQKLLMKVGVSNAGKNYSPKYVLQHKNQGQLFIAVQSLTRSIKILIFLNGTTMQQDKLRIWRAKKMLF